MFDTFKILLKDNANCIINSSRLLYESYNLDYDTSIEIDLDTPNFPLFRKIKNFIHDSTLKDASFEVTIDKTEYTLLLKKGNDEIHGILLEIPNLTERNKQVKQYYESILSNSSLYIIRTDLAGNYTYVNEYFKEVFGDRHNKFIGENSMITIHPDDWDKTKKAVEECILKPDKSISVSLRKLQGNCILYGNWEFSLIKGNNGLQDEIQCIGFDDTSKQLLIDENQALLNRNSIASKVGGFGIWEYHIEKDELFWDDYMFELYGVSKDNFNNDIDSWKKPVIEEDIEPAVQKLKDSITNNNLFNAIFRIKKNGTIRYIEGYAHPFTEQGVSKFIGINRDITDEYLSKLEIKKLQELQNEVGSIGAIGGWEYDIEADKLTWTDAIYEVFEKNSSENISPDAVMEQFIKESNNETIQFLFYRLINEGIPFDAEHQFISDRGNVKWVRTTGYKTLDGLRAIGAFQDITKYKSQELSLKEYNTRLQTFSDIINYSLAIVYTDLKGNITQCNDNYVLYTGYQRKELVGNNFSIINSGYHTNDFWADMWNTLSAKKVWYGQIKNKAKNGDFYWVDAHIYPISDNSGKVQEYMEVSRNITLTKEYEHELQQEISDRTDSLNKALTEKSFIIDMLVHDVRNPVSALLLQNDLLELKTNSENPIYKHIINQKHELERVNGMLTSFLKLDRLEDISTNINKVHTDIDVLVDRRIQIYSEAASDKNILIDRKTSETSLNIYTDQNLFVEILDNIISNAIKYSPLDSSIEIKTYVSDEDSKTVVSITDSGEGFTESEKSIVFDKYAKINHTPTNGEHTFGLGLAIAHKISELLDIRLELISKKNEGSTFLIII